MDKMDIITKVIPLLLVICIVYYNMRKLRKSLDTMKQEHCNGSCQGCAHSADCASARSSEKEEEPRA